MSRAILYARPKLKEIRELKGYKQAEMAEYLSLMIGEKISAVTYQKWEQGAHNVPVAKVLELARALKTPISELFEQKG